MNGDEEDFAGWLGGELGYSDEDIANFFGGPAAPTTEPSSDAVPPQPQHRPRARRQNVNLLPQYGNAAMWWGYDDAGRLVPFGKHMGGLWTATGRFIPNTSPEYQMHANF